MNEFDKKPTSYYVKLEHMETVKEEQRFEEVEERKRSLKKRTQKSRHISTKGGRWQLNEERIYLKYIEQNSQQFINENARRSTKVFDSLSKILNNGRTADQCRSHHQKIQKQAKTKSIKGTLKFLQQRYAKKKESFKRKNKQKRNKRTKIIQEEDNLYNIVIQKEFGTNVTIIFNQQANFNIW